MEHMSDIKIATVSVVFAILIIALTIGVMNFIYPNEAVEIDTTNMDKEQIELLREWVND